MLMPKLKQVPPPPSSFGGIMMLFFAVGLIASTVIGFILFKLGFHLGKQMSQTQHVRDHLEETRSQRQTLQAQQVG